MSSQVYTAKLAYVDEKILVNGKVLPYREVMLSKDNEILVRGETLFQG